MLAVRGTSFSSKVAGATDQISDAAEDPLSEPHVSGSWDPQPHVEN